jgi:hypothetical protein
MREPETLRTAGLIMAMFYEWLAGKLEAPKGPTAEGSSARRYVIC